MPPPCKAFRAKPVCIYMIISLAHVFDFFAGQRWGFFFDNFKLIVKYFFDRLNVHLWRDMIW